MPQGKDEAAEATGSRGQGTAVEEPERAMNAEDETDMGKYIEEINQHRQASDKARLYFDNTGKLVIKGVDLQKDAKARDQELKESQDRCTALQGTNEKLAQEKNLADEQIKQLQYCLNQELEESQDRYTALQGSNVKLAQEKNLADEQIKQLQHCLNGTEKRENEAKKQLEEAQEKIEEYRKRDKLLDAFINMRNALKLP
jgi:chromosome segregation ATPase